MKLSLSMSFATKVHFVYRLNMYFIFTFMYSYIFFKVYIFLITTVHIWHPFLYPLRTALLSTLL